MINLWRSCVATAVTMVLSALIASGDSAAAPPPTLIGSCPTSINAAGLYEVTTDLTANGDCITIAATGVVLGLRADITGNGINGRGIVITSGASGAVIRGDASHVISGFDVGVEDDQGDSVIGDFAVDSNVTSGLLLDGTDPALVDNLEADSNGHDGIHLKSSGNRLNFLKANSNGTFGVWLDGADHSVLSVFQTKLNGTTGVEIAGSSNFIDNCVTTGGQFGVVIEKGATQNAVADCRYNKNDAAPSTEGALDKNPRCDHNVWADNSFKTRKPGCIH